MATEGSAPLLPPCPHSRALPKSLKSTQKFPMEAKPESAAETHGGPELLENGFLLLQPLQQFHLTCTLLILIIFI